MEGPIVDSADGEKQRLAYWDLWGRLSEEGGGTECFRHFMHLDAVQELWHDRTSATRFL